MCNIGIVLLKSRYSCKHISFNFDTEMIHIRTYTNTTVLVQTPKRMPWIKWNTINNVNATSTSAGNGSKNQMPSFAKTKLLLGIFMNSMLMSKTFQWFELPENSTWDMRHECMWIDKCQIVENAQVVVTRIMCRFISIWMWKHHHFKCKRCIY